MDGKGAAAGHEGQKEEECKHLCPHWCPWAWRWDPSKARLDVAAVGLRFKTESHGAIARAYMYTAGCYYA